jgi:ketosteroid isomerase-like protein
MRRPVLVLLCASLVGAGCGGDPDPEAGARETVERFAEATREKDYHALCDDILSPELVERVRAQVPCEVALRTGLEDVEQPRLTVRDVRVRGDTALAVVRTEAANQQPSEDTLRLVRTDEGWRVASLASPQPPAPTSTTP